MGRSFQVTHPFHPLKGLRFDLVDCRCAWGEHRVYFVGDDGDLLRLSATWTDFVAADPFVVVAAGRAPFRLIDLLEVAKRLEESKGESKEDV